MKSKVLNKNLRLVILLFAIILTSCKKEFLEIVPKGSVILTTTKDYDLAFNTLTLYNMGTDGQVPMGDEVAAYSPAFSVAALRTQRLFRYEGDVYQNGESAPEMNVPMQSIYLYNTIIEGVMGSTGGDEATKAALQGEALAGRAFTNFLLINYYGKPYNAASAATDSGFPIIRNADATQTTFKRSSVQEVYDFIIDDLKSAISKLPEVGTNRTRMSKATAEALLGKVYVFMRRFNEAMPLFDASLGHINQSAFPIRIYDYNSEMKPGGALALLGTGIPASITLPNNLESMYGRQFSNSWTDNRTYQLLVKPTAAALYGTSDLRNTFLTPTLPDGKPLPAGLKRKRWPTTVQIGMYLPELYLLRAECKARLNDLPGAVSDIEYLRVRRMPPADAKVPSGIAGDKAALVKYIFEERIREFSLQGYRWFDMRRLSADAEFASTVGYVHEVYNETGAVLSTHTLKPERFVFRFPQLVTSQNPGLENNP